MAWNSRFERTCLSNPLPCISQANCTSSRARFRVNRTKFPFRMEKFDRCNGRKWKVNEVFIRMPARCVQGGEIAICRVSLSRLVRFQSRNNSGEKILWTSPSLFFVLHDIFISLIHHVSLERDLKKASWRTQTNGVEWSKEVKSYSRVKRLVTVFRGTVYPASMEKNGASFAKNFFHRDKNGAAPPVFFTQLKQKRISFYAY